MTKKIKSKIISFYLALPYGYIKKNPNKNVYLHFANLEIRGGGGASPPGFTWPAWSSSWMFVISTTNSYKFRVHSRVHRGRTSRVRGLYKSWNSCSHSLFIPFYHLEYIHAFFSLFQLIQNVLLKKYCSYSYHNSSCKNDELRALLPVNHSGTNLYLRLRGLHNTLPHPIEAESYQRSTSA